jgi:hypothetical protein
VAFLADRSIWYSMPSMLNVMVSSAVPPSRSSMSMWMVRFATVVCLLVGYCSQGIADR